ncbi:MAG TPA: arsinothricin resistance N-acetyltransferase ArsN1 family B [Chitinophagaceae bacterium]
MIRLATAADAKAILAIYAPYISNTSFTFETEVPTVSPFADRIETYLQSWPWLVYEIDGIVVGYAYATRHRERTAYQWSVECSVYIHDDYLRKGIAHQLYEKLFQLLKIQGFTTVYAVINLPNDRSVAFHESMDFTYFATYEKVGFKLGKWKNVGWWQLRLNDFLADPADPVLLKNLDQEKILSILEK